MCTFSSHVKLCVQQDVEEKGLPGSDKYRSVRNQEVPGLAVFSVHPSPRFLESFRYFEYLGELKLDSADDDDSTTVYLYRDTRPQTKTDEDEEDEAIRLPSGKVA